MHKKNLCDVVEDGDRCEYEYLPSGGKCWKHAGRVEFVESLMLVEQSNGRLYDRVAAQGDRLRLLESGVTALTRRWHRFSNMRGKIPLHTFLGLSEHDYGQLTMAPKTHFSMTGKMYEIIPYNADTDVPGGWKEWTGAPGEPLVVPAAFFTCPECGESMQLTHPPHSIALNGVVTPSVVCIWKKDGKPCGYHKFCTLEGWAERLPAMQRHCDLRLSEQLDESDFDVVFVKEWD